MSSPVAAALLELRDEILTACDRFPAMHSPHEGIAVIEEEFLELREHVYGDTGRTSLARAEAIQLAAMGVRYAADLTEATRA